MKKMLLLILDIRKAIIEHRFEDAITMVEELKKVLLTYRVSC